MPLPFKLCNDLLAFVADEPLNRIAPGFPCSAILTLR